jgi:uncharacterized SAM-binding protein YcdF (DUF218 family)
MTTLLVVLCLPPVSLAALALLGVGTAFRYRRAGLTLAFVSLALLIVLALPAVADGLLASLEQGLPLAPPGAAPPAAIVILSGDLAHADPPSPALDVGELTLERLRAGAALHRRTGLPVLLSGGPFRGQRVALASLMARSLADDFGVAARWTETRSQDTWGNAQQSAEILAAAGIRSVYVVTQAWHMRRAIIAFAHFGVTVTAAPTRIDTAPEWTLPELIPSSAAWRESYYGLHEWVGRAYYAVR